MLTLALARQSEQDWPPSLHWLAGGERARLAAQGSPGRRRQFLAGRWLVRQLLAGDPIDIDVEGRSHRPRGHANLSHSGDWILAVIADQAIGVDMEVLRPRADLMGLARLVLCAAECQALQAIPRDRAWGTFYRGWTLKEAWFKAHGLGLDMARLRSLNFVSDHSRRCDSACAVLPGAGLVLSVHQPGGLEALPGSLLGRPVPWQRFRCLAPC